MSSINKLDTSGELGIENKSIKNVASRESPKNNLNNNHTDTHKQLMDNEEISSDPSSS